MGTQSTNLTCTSEPFRGEWEKVEASMKKKKPRENWELGQYDGRMHGEWEPLQQRLQRRRLPFVWWYC